MFTLPDPLHPVIVHFPIVLVLLGAAVAVVAVMITRWQIPWIAAVLLTLGSTGAFVASQTGETAGEHAGPLTPTADALLEEHEEAAERVEAASAIAAVLAIVAAAVGFFRNPRVSAPAPGALQRDGIAAWIAKPGVSLSLRVLTALAAMTACYFIYETGHAGGKLVYQHGVGVKLPAGQQAARTIHN